MKEMVQVEIVSRHRLAHTHQFLPGDILKAKVNTNKGCEEVEKMMREPCKVNTILFTKPLGALFVYED